MGHFFIYAFYNGPVTHVVQFCYFCIKIDFRGPVGDIFNCFHLVTLCNAKPAACGLLCVLSVEVCMCLLERSRIKS